MHKFYLELTVFFKTIDQDSARQFACELVIAINEAIRSQLLHVKPPLNWPPPMKEIVRNLPLQPVALQIPWQAFNAVRTGADTFTPSQGLDALLVTMPPEYIAPVTGIPVRQLLDHVADILKFADEVYIVSPYWSTAGVDHFKRYIGKSYINHFPGKINLVSPSQMTQDNLDGRQNFINWCQSLGSHVSIYTPSRLQDQTIPFLHAKMVVSNSGNAYIGSANISDYGLFRSIECGVAISGHYGLSIYQWIKNTLINFDKSL